MTTSESSTDAGPGADTPPQDAPSHTPRLVRLVDDAKWAGVASGIAWYLGKDPTVIRIAFFVLAFMTNGMAFGLYVVLWFILPKARRAEVGPPPPRGALWRSNSAVALALVGGLLLISAVDLVRGDVLFAGVLIGAGLLLLDEDRGRINAAVSSALESAGQALTGRASGERAAAPPSGHASTDSPTTGAPPAAPSAQGTTDAPPAAAPSAPPHSGTDTANDPGPRQAWPGPDAAAGPGPCGPSWGRRHHGPPASAYPTGYAGKWTPPRQDAPPRRPPRPRSTLGPLTFAVWLLAMGAAIALDRLGLVTLDPEAAVGLSVLVAGAGLLVGTFFGRARGLILFGVAGTLALVLLGVAGDIAPGLEAGVGERTHAPASVADLEEAYALGIGSLEVDLSRLALDGDTVTVDAAVVVGELRVIVPPDVDVVATGSIGAGEYDVLGESSDGTSLQIDSVDDLDDDQGTLRLDLDARLGQVTVERGERR